MQLIETNVAELLQEPGAADRDTAGRSRRSPVAPTSAL